MKWRALNMIAGSAIDVPEITILQLAGLDADQSGKRGL
jgi:hypothetical protein